MSFSWFVTVKQFKIPSHAVFTIFFTQEQQSQIPTIFNSQSFIVPLQLGHQPLILRSILSQHPSERSSPKPIRPRSQSSSDPQSYEEGDEETLVQDLRVPDHWLNPSKALEESEWLRVTLHKWLDDEYCLRQPTLKSAGWPENWNPFPIKKASMELSHQQMQQLI
ncbi:hypothetical protein CK203_002787 [Vitis vinifera]|uniref:Uncharacterized protein n=1 Tax=Vitis vinifera TaxID=29760 RepID=A0A438KI51_VITVI|nr:hypothetical protein CK203_002787 [Vitis vinifera]